MSLLTDLFDAQLAVLKSDFSTDIVPVLQKSTNLLASNPTELNLVAQATQILATGATELPKLGQDELKALAQWVNAQLQRLATPPAKS
jgi:hypothetical protein